MAEYNFNDDITVGEKGEEVIKSILEKKGLKFISDNKDSKYDLKMELNSKIITFEVKTDVWCVPGRYLDMPFGRIWVESKDSGNLFIEFESWNRPAGIDVTNAQVFIYYFPYFNEYWTIKTSDLKRLITNNKFRQTKLSGDEGSNTRGYLIPREKYKTYFKVHKADYKWEK